MGPADEPQGPVLPARKRLRRLHEIPGQPAKHQPPQEVRRHDEGEEAVPGAPREAGDDLRLWGESQNEVLSALATPEDALRLVGELHAQIQALEDARALDTAQFEFFVQNPHLIALHRGDAYLYKDAMEEFRAPLGILLYHLLPRATPPPEQPATTTAGPEMAGPADGGVAPEPHGRPQDLTSTVVAVLGVLASLGILTSASSQPPSPPPLAPHLPFQEPPLGAYLDSAPPRPVSRPGVLPPRPTLAQFGDSAPARQAIYDLLFKK